MSGILPRPTWRITLRIWPNCLTSRLTAFTLVPEPRAMRRRREPLISSGRRLSCGNTQTLLRDFEGFAVSSTVIMLNMQALDPLPRQVQWLIYYHECGHILYGPSETSADNFPRRIDAVADGVGQPGGVQPGAGVQQDHVLRRARLAGRLGGLLGERALLAGAVRRLAPRLDLTGLVGDVRVGIEPGLERDPRNGSLWIGYYYGGLARLDGSHYVPFDYRVFGPDLVRGRIPDIQSDNFGGQRRILVAFFGGDGRPGAIGIYTGD